MYNFYNVYRYTGHLFLLYLGVLMEFPSTIVGFYVFYDRSVDMQILNPSEPV